LIDIDGIGATIGVNDCFHRLNIAKLKTNRKQFHQKEIFPTL
jgi:hypothetical protein